MNLDVIAERLASFTGRYAWLYVVHEGMVHALNHAENLGWRFIGADKDLFYFRRIDPPPEAGLHVWTVIGRYRGPGPGPSTQETFVSQQVTAASAEAAKTAIECLGGETDEKIEVVAVVLGGGVATVFL